MKRQRYKDLPKRKNEEKQNLYYFSLAPSESAPTIPIEKKKKESKRKKE